jgi:polyisoprenoid-binding protein YceI
MTLRHSALTTLATGFAVALFLGAHTVAAPQDAAAPLGIASARVAIAGTSNIHAYTASTTAVRVTRAKVSGSVAGPNFWDEVVKPAGLEAFEIAIPVVQLSSPKEGLDKNMHKALKAEQFPEITFRLVRVELGVAGAIKAIGKLRIAGVERDVMLDLKTQRKDATLTVKGELPILMTDYGIKPPTAMLGMLKTDPKVTVTFETVLAVPLT